MPSRLVPVYENKFNILENYPFTKILTVRQAIGRAIVNVPAKDKAYFHSHTVDTLVILLQQLLPNIGVEKIRGFATKLMDKSVSLRAAMTEEQAIYRCYFVDSGQEFKNDWMEIASGETPGKMVTMCTFPGLRRLTTKNGGKEFITVVKATTKLGSP